jgi:hypothetical protein
MESLLQTTEQSELFDPRELPAGLELLLPREVQEHRFTAERVARNQDRYRSIVEALASGMPVRAIMRAFRVSDHTIQVIRSREPELVATEKRRLGALMLHTAGRCVERFGELLDSGMIKGQEASVGSGIFTEKALLLAGDATARVEHVHIDVTPDQVNAWMSSLPPAQVTEVKTISAPKGEPMLQPVIQSQP